MAQAKMVTENEPEKNPDAAVKSEKSGVVSGKLVRYIGTVDVREINSASWDSLGSSAKMTRWHKANGFSVDVADLDDAALAYLESDPDFVIVDAPVA